MNAINYAAVRAFRKVFAPIEFSLAVGREADAGFDAGEWSGPAHSRIEEQEHAECVARVAARFGMTAEELDHDVCHACHIEDDCFYRAVFEAIEEPL